MSFTVKIPVRWADTDAYQHVNNSVYFRYFEEVRFQWQEGQLRFKQWTKAHALQFVIASQKADYKKPVTYPNMLKIKQTPLMISNSSFTLAYEITLENDDNVYCTGEVKLVCFDPKTKRPYKMPDDIKSLLENA
ncbi:acyl-CoA thioesterase [Caedibacter taeniospiralis]|uniref:acyl-CoA thioesterase n=1 Tax=Caedibacter taeniospiralis TaxID=28907 RepID=UPI000C280020|nr:thioesterase family protein [Caedibacter taeniospiralis]